MAYSSLLRLHSRDLTSEAEVETRLLAPLFHDLGYPPTTIKPKKSVPPLLVASGARKKPVQVDFLLCRPGGAARIVVEAKEPNKSLADAWGQAAGYALAYNSDKPAGERIKWLLISNGHLTSLYEHDSSQPTLTLRLSDFVSGSPPYAALRSLIKHAVADSPSPAPGSFDIITPDQLNILFNQSHQLIWKKQKMSPTDAFFEFCKFVFIKLTEDKKREAKLEAGKTELFPMTTEWLTAVAATSNHPVRDILFIQLRDQLEAAISKGKKRIFEPNETLKLSADTCRELIKRFERVNLSSIDEDLNGRMFEVFLNEAVRGKDLGQYFTPRPLVEFMTRIALKAWEGRDSSPKTLDACCGTAGFLIEIMAFQLAALRNDTRLSDPEKRAREKAIKNEYLFGVEANERVSRVARINMYLHGDGGSHIFHGDGLDKEPTASDDMSDEQRDEAIDHAASIKESSFDLVLTNPPFSMEYSVKEPDEERILRQMSDAGSYDDIPIILDDANKLKSNILFLFRYSRLLKPGGEMLIVLDDTVLNGDSMLSVREWLLKNFVLLGVHSLPFNAFFKAKANIKTSVLHVRKKLSPTETQQHVFMSISNNIGHDSSLRDTPERNNLNDIFTIYDEWQRTGQLKEMIKENQDSDERLECPSQVWLLPPSKLDVSRIDAFYYAPVLHKVRKEIKRKAAAGEVIARLGGEFRIRAPISPTERARLVRDGTMLRYFEIGDVTQYGLIVNSREGTLDTFPTRGKFLVRTGDVLVALNNSSRGTVVLVPKSFDGAVCTSGFLVLQPKNESEGRLLWYALRSELCRDQIYYLAQTASQPELKRPTWASEFLVPMPIGAVKKTAERQAKEFHQHLAALLGAESVRL